VAVVVAEAREPEVVGLALVLEVVAREPERVAVPEVERVAVPEVERVADQHQHQRQHQHHPVHLRRRRGEACQIG
jgi:hypothetical protein